MHALTAEGGAGEGGPGGGEQVNKNYETALHVDGNNMGPSYIVGLGDYDGGQVRVRGFGFGHSQPAAPRCALDPVGSNTWPSGSQHATRHVARGMRRATR